MYDLPQAGSPTMTTSIFSSGGAESACRTVVVRFNAMALFRRGFASLMVLVNS
jgi:hypothetical protein